MTQQAHEEEKKRMITLLRKEYGDDVWLGSTKCGACNAYTQYTDIETVVDYLLSNGAMMPPFKVGDTVYCATLRSIDPVIKQETVERIQYTEQGFYYGMQKGIYFEDEVFFAREAAEEALKERDQHE